MTESVLRDESETVPASEVHDNLENPERIGDGEISSSSDSEESAASSGAAVQKMKSSVVQIQVRSFS